ncbi:MAG: acetyl-CoA carboxylase biotin carboxyl carrier protein subunit [Bacteroidota bacterium]
MRTFDVTIQEEKLTVTLAEDGTIHFNGVPVKAEIIRIDQYNYSVLINGQSFNVLTLKSGDVYNVLLNAVAVDVQVESERTRLLKKYGANAVSTNQNAEIHAPMPALIVKVEVAVGDEVQQGQGLVVLEAMKMENEIKAHRAGRVKQILVQRGATVEKGELLLVLE